MVFEYENLRRVTYDCGENGLAVFVPVCTRCGRFVRMDEHIRTNAERGWDGEPNATCKRCGRIRTPFEGFFEKERDRE